MPTKEPTTTPSNNENVTTQKLSLVSETKESPTDLPPEGQRNGLSSQTQNATLPSQELELTKEDKKILAKMRKKMEKAGVKPAPGFAFNPLLKLEPNRPCPCLSEKKFKVCCRDKLAPFVTVEIAKEFEAQMAKEDLVFMTPDNKDKIAERIAPHVKANIERQQREANEKAAFEKREIDNALANTKRH